MLGDGTWQGYTYCHTGSSVPGNVPPGCVDSGDVGCSGSGYGSGWDPYHGIYTAWATCSNGSTMSCSGYTSAEAGVDSNGEKFVACLGPWYSSDSC